MNTFIIKYKDEYHTGPKFWWEKVTHLSEYEINQKIEKIFLIQKTDCDYVEIKYTNDYVVYKSDMDLNGVKLNELKSFELLDCAQVYMKSQYKLYTNNFPFIKKDVGKDYKSIGDREKFEIPKDISNDIDKFRIKFSYDSIMLCKEGEILQIHSLDRNSEW